MNNTYLAHYGVLGMKWGVRNYQNKDGSLTSAGKRKYSDKYSNMKSAKAAKKEANREYSKSFNRARNYSAAHIITQFKKGRKAYNESDKRWDDAINKAEKANKASKDYRKAKYEYKQQLSENKNLVNSKATKGDRLIYNQATRNKAAKLMTKYENVSYDEAITQAKGEAKRNTAIIVAAYGAQTAYNLYKIKNL